MFVARSGRSHIMSCRSYHQRTRLHCNLCGCQERNRCMFECQVVRIPSSAWGCSGRRPFLPPRLVRRRELQHSRSIGLGLSLRTAIIPMAQQTCGSSDQELTLNSHHSSERHCNLSFVYGAFLASHTCPHARRTRRSHIRKCSGYCQSITRSSPNRCRRPGIVPCPLRIGARPGCDGAY